MTYQSLEAEAVHRLFLQQPADHVWIDVRQPEEWAEGTLPGVRRISLGELEDELPALNPESTYVLICRSGNRSARACEMMQRAGFGRLINFAGGMLAWYGAHFPVE